MAKECGIVWQRVREVVRKEKIIPAKIIGRKQFYNEYQEEYIHSILYFSLICKELTIESKINKPEKQEPFEDFKKRVYGRKN